MRWVRYAGPFLVLLIAVGSAPTSTTRAGALSTSMSELATELMTSPNVGATGRLVENDLVDAELGQPATAGAYLDVALLQLLVVLAQHHSFNITALESGGTGHCNNLPKSSCPSHDAHYYGAAADIAMIDGISTTGRDPGSIDAINTVLPLIPTTPGAYGSQSGFGQQGCPGASTPPLPAGVITFPDVCNHLHIQVPIDAGAIASGPVVGENVAATRNKDGRLELFAIRSDGTPEHRWQLTAGSGWSTWATFDGSVTAIAAGTNADGRVELFAVRSDGTPEHRWQMYAGGPWSPWATFNDGAVSQLSVARNGDGRLEIFAVGAFGTPVHRWQMYAGGPWSPWQLFDGTITSIAAATNADGRIEFFGVTPAGNPEHRWQEKPGSTWSGWQVFTGPVRQVGLGQNQDGRLELFAVAANATPQHRYQYYAGGNWSGWRNFDGAVSSVAAATNADGRLEFFAVRSDGVPEHRWQQTPEKNWSAWQTFDGSLR